MRLVRKASAAAAALASMITFIAVGAQTIKVPPPSSTAGAHDVSMDDYRQHLAGLAALVDACAKERNTKACDPALVGPDDHVPIAVGSATGQRRIRYGWLRVLFSKAEEPDLPLAKPDAKEPGDTRPKITIENQPPTSQLLKEARQRLEADLALSQVPLAQASSHARSGPSCSRCFPNGNSVV